MSNAKRTLFIVALSFVPLLHAQTTDTKKFQMSPLEQKLLDLTNEERKKEELPALKPDPVLCQVARGHSANMAKQQKMLHDLDGKTPFDRIKGSGYKYFFAAENIAAGDVPMDVIMAAWMKSEGHRKNILDKKYTHIGIGIVRNEKGDLYYTQNFAKPMP